MTTPPPMQPIIIEEEPFATASQNKNHQIVEAEDVVIVEETEATKDIVKLSDKLSIVCNFLVYHPTGRQARVIMPESTLGTTHSRNLTEHQEFLIKSCWNSDNFRNSKRTKLPDIETLFTVVKAKSLKWEDDISRPSITFRLNDYSWRTIALADSFTAEHYDAVSNFFGEHYDSYSEGFRTTLHTLLNIAKYDPADYPKNSTIDNPEFMVTMKEEFTKLFLNARDFYEANEMPLIVNTFFNPESGGNFFNYSNEVLKRYAHEFAMFMVKFKPDINENTDVVASAEDFCRTFAQFAIDNLPPPAQAKVVEFLRFICFDGAHLASFNVIRRNFDVFKCAMKVGSILLSDYSQHLADCTKSQGMKLISNVYQALVNLEESNIRPVNTHSEGRVIIHNRFFTWSDVKQANDFLVAKINHLLAELHHFIPLPTVTSFHQEFLVSNPHINGTYLGTAQTHNMSFRESFGKYPSCAVFHLVQAALDKCTNFSAAENLLNRIIELLPCLIQWAGCAPIRSPEFNTYCLSGTMKSFHFQRDAVIVRSFYSKTASTSANTTHIRFLPGDCAVFLMYHAIVLKHVQLYLFQKNNSDTSLFVLPDDQPERSSGASLQAALRFIQEKVFVNSKTLNYFDHTHVFKQNQPWSQDRRLGLSDFRHALIALQKSTTFAAPLIDDTHKVFAHLSGHNVTTRITSYGTNSDDANAFAAKDTASFRRVIEFLHHHAAFEPMFKWPSVSSTTNSSSTSNHVLHSLSSSAAPATTSIIRGHHLHDFMIASDTYLRPLQKFVCHRLLASSNCLQFFEMATGAGKTATIVRMLQLMANNSTHSVHIVMEPVNALADQVRLRLRASGIDAGAFSDITDLVHKNVYVVTYADLTSETTACLQNICIKLNYSPGFCFLDEVHSAVADTSYRMENLQYLPSLIRDISWLSVSGFTGTMGDTAELFADWCGYKKGGVKYLDHAFNELPRVSVPFKKHNIEPVVSTHSSYCFKLVTEDPTAHLSLRTINSVDRNMEVLVKLVQPLKKGAVLCYRLADVAKIVQQLNKIFGPGYALPLASSVSQRNVDYLFKHQPQLVVGTSSLNMGIDFDLEYTVLFDYDAHPYELLQWLGRQRKKGTQKFHAFEVKDQDKDSSFTPLPQIIKNFYNIDAAVDYQVLNEIDVENQLSLLEVNEDLNEPFENHNPHWSPTVDICQQQYWESSSKPYSGPPARVPVVQFPATTFSASPTAKRVALWDDQRTPSVSFNSSVGTVQETSIIGDDTSVSSFSPLKKPKLLSTSTDTNIYAKKTIEQLDESNKLAFSVVGYIYRAFRVFGDIYSLTFTDGTASPCLRTSFYEDRLFTLGSETYDLPDNVAAPCTIKGSACLKVIDSLGIDRNHRGMLPSPLFVVVTGTIGICATASRGLEIKIKTIQKLNNPQAETQVVERLKKVCGN